MRLSAATVETLPAHVAHPAYERDAHGIGIVHFGLGAFARAHLAWYTQQVLADAGGDWRITGVSMRSTSVAEQLGPQDGLYTLTARSGGAAATQVVGAVAEVLVAGRDRDAILARIADPDCRIVSFTVTEKGYCRAADGSLDLEVAAEGFYPILTQALERRRAAGLPGVTLLSCDNLAHNGAVLGHLMREWLEAEAPGLRDWFDAECTTPSTMVDRIVPATSDADLDALEDRIGLRDEGAIFTEAFSQWVIEDDFAGPRPAWDAHGAEIVGDVAPYETAKLRMLNGAHSALAYAGLAAGHEFVHEAVADPNLRALADRLMRQEAAPSLDVAPGQDLGAYADRLLERFADPALNHRLAQIAMDGSQKIPQRWLETLAFYAPQSCPAILDGIAAWLWHLRDGRFVDDPRGDALQELARRDDAVAAIFGPGGPLASDWRPTAEEMKRIDNRLGELP